MSEHTKLNAAIDAAEATSLGSDRDGDLSSHRALALDAYQGVNIDPAPSGRSQVVDWTVFETIQWILPSLTRIFAGGDNVVEFAPTGPEDEQVAEQESDYLNYLVTQKNNWFLILLTWFQDALLTKNAYCMAFIEEKLKTEKNSYIGQSEEALTLLLEEEGVEVVEGNSYPDPNDTEKLIGPDGQPIPEEQMEQALALFAQQGIEPQIQPPRTLYDITTRKTTPEKKLQFRVIPPERVKVGEDTPDFTTEKCNYFEIFEDVTISDLRAQGFDIDDDIASDDNYDGEEDTARNTFNENFTDPDRPDPSMRVVRARTIWIRFDEDEDGIAELLKVIRVGTTILNKEDASRIPVASIVPFINTHRHIGASVADLTFDLQRIKTALLRGGLDSLYLSQNPRHVVSDKVNLDDMLVSRPGGTVRLKDGRLPSEGHVMPLQTEFTLPQTLEGLRHMDTVVESRVGINKLFQGIDQGQMNDYNRIGQLSTMAAQRVEQIARIFANGVEYLFSISHELVIKSGHQAETTKLRGNWVTIDPSQWRTGRDMRMVAPFAAGNKDTLVARLMNIGLVQEKALASGLPIVTPDDAYNTAIELVKAADFPAPEKFFTDPKTIPPPEPAPDYTMMALEVEDKKVENEAIDEQRSSELDKYKTDISAEIDKYKADLNSETQIALARVKAGQVVDLERMKNNLSVVPFEVDGSQVTTEHVKEILVTKDKTIEMMLDEISELQHDRESLKEIVNAPKEIVRDRGKVVGIRQNGNVRRLQRGSDGKVKGLEAPAVLLKPKKAEPKMKEKTEELFAKKLSKNVQNTLSQMATSLNNLEKSANAPKEVVRDKSGRVTGIKQDGKVRKIKRDKEGRVASV